MSFSPFVFRKYTTCQWIFAIIDKIFRKDREKTDNMDGMSPTLSPKTVENNREQDKTNKNRKTAYVTENKNK